MKKILSFIMAAMMVVMMLPAVVGAADPTYVAAIGDAKYETLAAAVAAANAGDKIDLLGNSIGAGIVINKNLTIDFHGFTYTVGGPAVGSTGTATLGFQILYGTDMANPIDVVFANGTIKADNSNIPSGSKPIKMLINNYADLTLKNMILDGTGLYEDGANYKNYVLSNNNGEVTITGYTNIKANPGDVAFDVCKYLSYPNVSVTVNTKGTITGDVEVSDADTVELVIACGAFVGFKDVAKYVASDKKFDAETGMVICKEHPADKVEQVFGTMFHRTDCHECGANLEFEPHEFTTSREGYKNVTVCSGCDYKSVAPLTSAQIAADQVKNYVKSRSTVPYAVAIDADETVVITNNTSKNRTIKDLGDSALYGFMTDVKYSFAAVEGYEIVSVTVDGVEVKDPANVKIFQIKKNSVIKVVTAAVEAE